MATPTVYAAKAQGDYPAERKTFLAGYIFGAPVKDMGWFASLLMALATGMMAFFLATLLGIVALLFWHSTGHQPDFAISYRLIGLPVGATVMVLALAYMGMLWVRRISRRS